MRSARLRGVGCRSAAGAAYRGAAPRAAPDGAPKWPFLRNKALVTDLARFLTPQQGASERLRHLWITGAKGSGASTAVQAAISQVVRNIDQSAPQPLATVVFDCSIDVSNDPSTESSSSSSTGLPAGQQEAKVWLRSFEEALREQLAKQLDPAHLPADFLELIAAAVIWRHAEAATALITVVEAIGNRQGLPGALPMGTELPMRDILAKYKSDVPKLFAHVSKTIVGNKHMQLRPANSLHIGLAMLLEAGSRVGAGPLRASEYLLAAAEGLTSIGCNIVLVLLRAEVLTHTQVSKPLQFGPAILQAIEACSDLGSGSRMGVLVQTRDALAVARARHAGAEVLTADEWPEAMARAVMLPRFIAVDDENEWHGVWTAVGGHAAHLKRLSELVVEERAAREAATKKEDMEEKRVEMMRNALPGRSPDAEEYAKMSQEQHKDDSYRQDARNEGKAMEGVLRRMPQGFETEVAAFGGQLTAFLRHPFLRGVYEDHASQPAGLASELVASLRNICSQPHVVAPDGGLDELSDPVMLSLLDVGLLVPSWTGASGPRLAPANQLTRGLLLAWIDTQTL